MPQTKEQQRKLYAANPEKYRKQMRDWRARNPVKVREFNKKRYYKNPERYRALSRKWLADLRKEMLQAYGAVCACCGETEKTFLTLDHINGGGVQERKMYSSNVVMYRIKLAGWPKDAYRVLCMNCNFATRFGKPCPHSINTAIGR